jgi:hypothetical protein
MDEDFFWGDLLAHIRGQALVSVVGPDVTLVKNVDGGEQTFTSLIGQRLVKEYRLSVPSEVATTGEAVALVLGERGRDEVDRLYRVIYDIINDLDPSPGDALCDLAAIDDLRLFVSTTPDRLLAKAINKVRFQGREETRELAFAPNQSTNAQAKNAQAADPIETVVLNLFGKAVSSPQYAIHDEDLLEWLCALLSEAASFPDWLAAPLKQRPTLFIGYDIPDWIGRCLLRMSSGDTRLSQRNQQFFFVGSSTAYEPSLLRFLKTFCRSTLVQHLDMDPIKFVADLRARWEKQPRPNPPEPEPPRPIPVSPEAASIFISYMREDGDAARRLYDEITKLGGDVWFDYARLLPGDTWEPEILDRIQRTVQLFVPVISANTERETEGFVFKEWNAAAERAQAIMGRRFIVPVVIDGDYGGDATRVLHIPDDFRRFNFGRAPGGEPDASLLEMLTKEIRAMRRTAAV